MTEQREAGWYPDPQMTGTQRYWDGDGWSEHVAPTSKTSETSTGFGALTIARGVAGGIVAVIVLLWVINWLGSESETECNLDNLESAMNGRSQKSC